MTLIYRPSGRAQEYSWLAINHYRGCLHRCTYCYVPGVTKNPNFYTEQSARKDVVQQLLREAVDYAYTDERVLLCFTCDPYQPLNDTLQLTRKVIKILKANSIPFQVLTKGGLRAVGDFDLYESGDAFATTLTFLDPKQSAKYEPGAALPENRLMAIQAAHDRRIVTWVSLEPVIDAKQSLKIIEKTHSYVDLYKIGKLNHQSSDINWRQFGKKAIELCRKFKTNYYVKNDLAKYLDGITFSNCDTRKIKNPKQKPVRKKDRLF